MPPRWHDFGFAAATCGQNCQARMPSGPARVLSTFAEASCAAGHVSPSGGCNPALRMGQRVGCDQGHGPRTRPRRNRSPRSTARRHKNRTAAPRPRRSHGPVASHRPACHGASAHGCRGRSCRGAARCRQRRVHRLTDPPLRALTAATERVAAMNSYRQGAVSTNSTRSPLPTRGASRAAGGSVIRHLVVTVAVVMTGSHRLPHLIPRPRVEGECWRAGQSIRRWAAPPLPARCRRGGTGRRRTIHPVCAGAQTPCRGTGTLAPKPGYPPVPTIRQLRVPVICGYPVGAASQRIRVAAGEHNPFRQDRS